MAGDQTFKAVLNDTNPKAKGRSFSIEISGTGYNHFLGKSIGDTVDGMFVGEGDKTLTGYKLEITGGSDTTGRAMRPDLDGGGVKPVLVSPGVGYKGKRDMSTRMDAYTVTNTMGSGGGGTSGGMSSARTPDRSTSRWSITARGLSA